MTLNDRNDAITCRLDEARRRIRVIVESSELTPAEKSQYRKIWDEEYAKAKQDLTELLDEIGRIYQ